MGIPGGMHRRGKRKGGLGDAGLSVSRAGDGSAPRSITPDYIEAKYRGKLDDDDLEELKRYAQFRLDRALREREQNAPSHLHDRSAAEGM